MDTWYVNCEDKYGYYLIMSVTGRKEAEETAAGMNSRVRSDNPRKFSFSRTAAPVLPAGRVLEVNMVELDKNKS